MALTLAQLQDYINTNVKKNGRQAITGDVMNYLMLQFVDWVDTYSALPDKGGHALKFLRVNAAETGYEWAAVSSGITVGTTPVTSGTDSLLFYQSGGFIQQNSNLMYSPSGNGLRSSATSWTCFRGDATTGIGGYFSNTQGLTGGNPALLISGGGIGVNTSSGGAWLRMQGTSDDQEMIRITQSNGATIGFRLFSNGKIGIGWSPTYLVDIKADTSSSSSILRIRNFGDSADLLNIKGNNSFTIGKFSHDGSGTLSHTGSLILQPSGQISIAPYGSYHIQFTNSGVGRGRFDGSNGNFCIGSPYDGGTGTKVLIIESGTTPTSVASGGDNAIIYTKDIVAGNAAIHSRSEGGDVVRWYSIGGWGTPTGTLTRTTFDASTVTLAELGERVAALITDLKTGHQLLKA